MTRTTILILVAGLVSASAVAQPRSGPSETGPAKESSPGNTPPADGQPSGMDCTGDRPWAKGVGDEQKKAAETLIDKGFELHRQFRFQEAARRYEEALTYWDHPAIHLALGRIYLSLVKPLEAHRSLQEAIRWGPCPLGNEDQFRWARQTLEQLRGQLAEIEVRCDVPGARVAVAGKPWLTCVGTESEIVPSGRYTLEIAKDGYASVTRVVALVAGRKAIVEVAGMTRERERLVFDRRWRPWKPLAVGGAGLALGLVGGALLWRSRSDYAGYGEALKSACGDDALRCPGVADDDALGLYRRARWENGIAVGSFIAGGAVLSAGLVMGYLNRAHSRIVPVPDGTRVRVVPIVSGDTAGVAGRLQF